MSTREELLTKLRVALDGGELHFPPANPQPLDRATRMTVTHAEGGSWALAQRFGEELTKLQGSFDLVETAPEARLALINRLIVWMAEDENARKGARLETGQERSILSSSPAYLPVPGLVESLADMGMTVVSPIDLRSEESREAVRFMRYGITGIEAAFASTGSMMVRAGLGQSRSASLLPLRHIALIPFSRLYPTMEAWLATHRDAKSLVEFFRTNAQLGMITGPSKSADIEGNLTLGVHGPKFVHAVIFGDE